MTSPYNIRIKGLQLHLDQTKDQHNGRGYAELVKYFDDGDEFGEQIAIRKLARLFNTSWPTMQKWLTILEEERRAK